MLLSKAIDVYESTLQAAERIGLPRAYPSLDALLDDAAVQVVHITSPNQLHHPQVKAILAAGRHVICEKPLATTSAESAELVALAAASDLITAVNFNIRFYPLNQHAHQMIADGALGEPHLVTGHYFQDWLLRDTDWNWRLEPDKGGSLRAVGDIGSHWIDLTSFITGLRVTQVMADHVPAVVDALDAQCRELHRQYLSRRARLLEICDQTQKMFARRRAGGTAITLGTVAISSGLYVWRRRAPARGSGAPTVGTGRKSAIA